MKDQTSPWYTETSDDRLERIRSHWQRGFAVGSPNSQMRQIQDDFCFVLGLLDLAHGRVANLKPAGEQGEKVDSDG